MRFIRFLVAGMVLLSSPGLANDGFGGLPATGLTFGLTFGQTDPWRWKAKT